MVLESPLGPPLWQGEPLPWTACRQCASGEPCVSPCYLCLGRTGEVNLLCSWCDGHGFVLHDPCPDCHGSGKRYAAAVVTLAFPDNTVHVRTVWADQVVDIRPDRYDGRPAWRVLDGVTVEQCARLFGAASDWRITRAGVDDRRPGTRWDGRFLPTDRDMLDHHRYGYVPRAPGPGDAVEPHEVGHEYLARLTTGELGARVFYVVAPPREPGSLEALCSIARGIGARLDVSVDPTVSPALWGIELHPAMHEPEGWPPRLWTLGDATAKATEDLPLTLASLWQEVPAGCSLDEPGEPQPTAVEEEVGARLCDWAGSGPIWATFGPDGWVLRRIEPNAYGDYVAVVAGSGMTLVDAAAPSGATPGAQPSPAAEG
jgi:hypothetical protein